MTCTSVEDFIEDCRISDMCNLVILGSGQPIGILVTNRDLDRPRDEIRRMTPERMRIAEHLMKPSPVREMLIAHKTVSEWLEQDTRRAKPTARIEAKQMLEEMLRRNHTIPGTTGRYGGWLTSVMPTSEAENAPRTIMQALRAFSTMIGRRKIYVLGRENGDA